MIWHVEDEKQANYSRENHNRESEFVLASSVPSFFDD